MVLCSAARTQCLENCPERRTISVTATATVTADADLAIVRVGYRLYGPDAKAAYESASQTSNAVMQALNDSGVPRSEIESSSQVLQRAQPYELQQIPMGSEERLRRQFTVIQNWTVRVKPDEAGQVLNTAINAGANESGWIEWTVQNRNLLQAQASANALANARVISQQMAEKLNVHLGHLVSANENQQGGRYVNGAPAGLLAGIGVGMGSGMGIPAGTQPLAINSRRVECNVTTYAVFAIVD